MKKITVEEILMENAVKTANKYGDLYRIGQMNVEDAYNLIAQEMMKVMKEQGIDIK